MPIGHDVKVCRPRTQNLALERGRAVFRQAWARLGKTTADQGAWSRMKERWLGAGQDSQDPLAAEAMIAAARAAFGHLEIRRSPAGLRYSAMAGWSDGAADL